MRSLCCLSLVCVSLGCSQLPRDLATSSRLPLTHLASAGRASPPQPTAARRAELWSLARQAEGTDQVEQAMQAYTELTRAFPREVASRHRLAVLHDTHGNPSMSTRFYEEALRLAPRDVGLLSDYAYSRYVQGDLEKAAQLLQQALQLDPQFPRAHNNFALVLARRGEDERAIASFQRGGLSRQQALENLRQSKRAAQLSSHTPPQTPTWTDEGATADSTRPG